MPTETNAVVRPILEELGRRGPRVWFRKNHGTRYGRSGIPDIEVIFRSCRCGMSSPVVVFLEAKRPGGPGPTLIQRSVMSALRRAGAFAYVVRSKDEAIRYLETLGLPPRVDYRKEKGVCNAEKTHQDTESDS